MVSIGRMKMAMMVKAVMMSFLLTVTQVPLVLGLQSTTPAFFWSSHHDNRYVFLFSFLKLIWTSFTDLEMLVMSLGRC